MNNFYRINTPLPPMLSKMIGVNSNTHYLGLFYQSTNPTWTDGKSTATFNFHYCWKPLTDHPAIRFPLAAALDAARIDPDEFDTEWCEPGLGSDDYPPTHLLILDTIEQKMAIAAWKTGHQFLKDQHPPRSPASAEEIAAERAAMLAVLQTLNRQPTMQEMNRRGMFEMFSTPDPKLVQYCQAMIAFLNQHLDPEIRQLLAQFNLTDQN